MRERLFGCLCLLLFTVACSDDDGKGDMESPFLEVAATDYEVVGAGNPALIVGVKSNIDWSIESDKVWCKVLSGDTGSGNADVQLEIAENLTQDVRVAIVRLLSADQTQRATITVRQSAPAFVVGGHYKLPVVFQMLYANKKNENQYIRSGHLKEVLAGVNRLYQESGQDLNLEFVMATEDPDGKVLEEPGVNRVAWTAGKMDCETFMSSREERHLNLIWDPDRYINIMLYTFSDESILGISQFPFTVSPDKLPGCSMFEGGVPGQENLNRPQCVSINNKYIYDTGASLSPANPDGTDTYVIETIAHELGHYLGLRHAFSEAISGCSDTDYCEDTPTYDRSAYLRIVQAYGSNYLQHLDELVMREDCMKGIEFTSDNIMDYSISYFNAFTANQAERVRYILERGVFIPGPKNRQTKTRTRGTGMLDLPIEIMK